MLLRKILMRALTIMMLFSTAALANENPPTITPRHVCGPAIMQQGIASVYSESLNHEPTASGEKLDISTLTAAHRTLGFGKIVEVTDRSTGKSVLVRIVDRGPFVKGRVIDITPAAQHALGHKAAGLYNVTLRLCK